VTDGDDNQTKVQRMLQAVVDSHSQTRVVVGDVLTLTSTIAPALGFGYYSGASVRASDDFISLAQQYTTFRVKAMMFTCYFQIPGIAVASTPFLSTFHSDVVSVVNPTSIADIIDGPDSKSLQIGGDKTVLTWFAGGVKENEFQTVGTPIDYGGLRFSYPSTSLATPAMTIIIKAVVDFRGRV